MDISDEVINLLKQDENITLVFKAVLPPSRNIAQMISAFANTSGGLIILGVAVVPNKRNEVIGLSEDFHANTITHKALDLLSPLPKIHYQYVMYKGKKIYAIKVGKSETLITIEGKKFVRDGTNIKLVNPIEAKFKKNGYVEITKINQLLESYKKNTTNSKVRLLENYQSILKIIDDLGSILYPEDTSIPTNVQEGKILTRILFSSFVDNFETYLSELLYEIYLANPFTLKSKQEVTVEEVLNCSDLEEFVKYLAKQKIGKLQKGSVKGFIKENQQIKQLGVIDEKKQNDIEKILQIRHLYSHRNGMVDEKFLQYFVGESTLNSEHRMSISEICETINYLAEIIDEVDIAAMKKYKLAQISN